MKKTKYTIDALINKYDDKNSDYRLMNEILYDIAKKYPNNSSENVIVAKTIILGRTYSASLERGRNKTVSRKEQTKVGKFYKEIAQNIQTFNLDNRIDKIKKTHKNINDDAIKEILSLHGELVSSLKQVTHSNKRSFVSKYLHFHMPDLVFIYDSITSSKIKKYVPNKCGNLIEGSWDKEYAIFVFRAYEIYKHLLRSNATFPSGDTFPRVIDNMLLRD